MIIYLVRRTYSTPAIAFIDKRLAEEYLSNHEFIHSLREIELVTDQFMEQILQPKESHENFTSTN